MKPLPPPRRHNGLQLLAAGLALGIAMLILVSLEYVDEHRSLLAGLEAQARVVGESSIPALIFEDAPAAAANLSSLGPLSSIRGAALYRIEEGSGVAVLFATHVLPGETADFPARGLPERFFSDIAVDLPLRFEGEPIGHIHVLASRDEMLRRVGRYLLTVMLVASGALVLAYLLTGRLRRRVSETERMLETRAHFDDLTGLPNRNLFQDRMARAVAQAGRDKRPLALLFCDLDNFKVINDSLGHATGDALLQLVGRRLRGTTRQTDTICRLGGDEFVAILEDCDAEGAARVADHLIGTLSEPYHLDDRTLSVGTSVGIALYPQDGEDAGQLLRAADTALYAAKSAGRNVFRYFSAALDAQAHERMALENGLRHALARGELYLHYQPQVNIAERRVVGAEALLRWRSDEFGEVSPVRFIPIAEECGLIGEIGAWVLNEACRQASVWLANQPDFVMAVNVSARQLGDPALVGQVADCLQRYALPPARLDLEITESALLTHSEEVDDNLRGLDALGVGLSLDDFGTGYSSLGYLKHLPIDRLKIDRGFVQHLPDNPDDAAIVGAILALAGALAMDVVAEGVETETQLAFLHAAGCRHAQGWLFGRAEAPEVFEHRFLPASADQPAVCLPG
jgi:diguanylate cyclase